MSGENFKIDPTALQAAAAKLHGHADEIEHHGRTLTARTAGRVGHGPLGEVVEVLVKRGLHAVSEGMTKAVSDFHRATAEGLVSTAKRAEKADTDGAMEFQVHGLHNTIDIHGSRTMPTIQDRFLGGGHHRKAHVDEGQHATEALAHIDELRPQVWNGFTRHQRIAVLQRAENIMGDLHGRPPARVMPMAARQGVNGAYYHWDHTIRVGSWSLKFDHPQEVLNTIVHEGRHAYQHHAVTNPGFHSDVAEVDRWRKNLPAFGGHYISYQEDPRGYRTQPTEKDAWEYGDRIAKGTYNRLSATDP